MIDEIDFVEEHKKADLSEINVVRVNGKVYLAADKVLEIIDGLAKKEIMGSIDNEVGYDEAIDDFREAVEALKGGAE